MATNSRSIRINIPDGGSMDWSADIEEARVLRSMANVVRTRRAMDPNQVQAREEPDYLIKSVIEAKNLVRDLLEKLPLRAPESRNLLLLAIDQLSTIQDAWFQASQDISGPRRRRFDELPHRQTFEVMEKAWPTVERVRLWMQAVAAGIESSLR